MEPCSLMVVEDDASLRLAIAEWVRAEPGFELVAEVGTALDALEQARQPGRALDAVIMDIGLPDGSGLDLIPQLRERHPDLRVLVLTGHDEAAVRGRLRELQVDGFMPKGQSPDELAERIRALRSDR